MTTMRGIELVREFRDEYMSEISEKFEGDGYGYVHKIHYLEGLDAVNDKFIVVFHLCKQSRDVFFEVTMDFFESLYDDDDDDYKGVSVSCADAIVSGSYVEIYEYIDEDGDEE